MMRPSQPARAGAVTSNTDARGFDAQLRRFRRRLRMVVAIRAFCLAAPIAAAGTVAMVWLFVPGAPVLLVLAVILALTLLATCLCTTAFAPDRARTARLVDRRAALQNSTATALQFLDCPDAVAALVVRHGAKKLSGLDPQRLFPPEHPRQRHVLASLGAACLVLLVSAYAARVNPDAESNAGSDVAAAAGVSQASRAPRAAGRSAQGPRGGGARVLQPAPAGTAASAIVQRETARAPAATAPGGQNRQEAQGSTTSNEASRAATSANSRVPPAPAVASNQATSPGADAARASADGRSTTGDALGAAGRAATPGGANAIGRSSRTGGGVKSGALNGRPQGAAMTAQVAGGFDAIAAARSPSRAEMLLANDRVPPALREYVKRYFASIREGGSR